MLKYVFSIAFLWKTRDYVDEIHAEISGQLLLLMLLCTFLVVYGLFLFLVCCSMKFYICTWQRIDFQWFNQGIWLLLQSATVRSYVMSQLCC